MAKLNGKIKVALIAFLGTVVLAGSNIANRILTVKQTNGNALKTAEEAQKFRIDHILDELEEQDEHDKEQDDSIIESKVKIAVLETEVQHIKETTDETNKGVDELLRRGNP